LCSVADMRLYEPPGDVIYIYEVDENGTATNVDTTIEQWDDTWRDLPSCYECACGYTFLSWDEALVHLGLDEDL